MIAAIKSCHVSDGLSVIENDKIRPTSRISIEAVMKFPGIFKGHSLLVELLGVDDMKLWNDIDSDQQCLGRIDWFGESSRLHIAAHLTLEAIRQIRYLLLGSESVSKHINATAVGLESIEFQKRELPKGVAVTNVSVSVKRNFDEAREQKQ